MRIIILLQKIEWINNLKILGILAVILGHIASPLGGFIYSWHMPLFFILAAFFIKFDLTFKEFVKKDFKRIMIPYFIFAIFGLFVETLKRLVLHRDSLDYVHELQGIFLWMNEQTLSHTYAFVLWFLPALFFSRLFLFIINKYIESLSMQILVITILFLCSFYINLPFSIDNGLNAIIFLFIGNLFYKSYQDNKFLYLLPIICIIIYLTFGIPNLDMASKYYSNIFVNVLWAISVVFIIIVLIKKINYSNKLLSMWGSNTMLLFIIHPYTNNIAYLVVEKLHFGDWYLKFFISLILLQFVLLLKLKFENKGIFKYV